MDVAKRPCEEDTPNSSHSGEDSCDASAGDGVFPHHLPTGNPERLPQRHCFYLYLLHWGLPRVLLTTESTFYYLSVQHECRFRDKDWVSYGHRGSFSAVQELATLRFHQESSSSWNSRHSKIRDEKIRDMKFQGFRVSHSIGGVLASNAPSPLTPPDCS